jgi:hypothetical protein
LQGEPLNASDKFSFIQFACNNHTNWWKNLVDGKLFADAEKNLPIL